MENVTFKQHVSLDLDSFIFYKFNIPYFSPSAWAVGFDRDRERARVMWTHRENGNEWDKNNK